MGFYRLKSFSRAWMEIVDRFSRTIAFSSFFFGITISPSFAENLPSSENDLESDLEGESIEAIEIVPSVSELRDILPTDWAYEALNNLAENYGCLVGFEGDRYGGSANLSRAEFAVMLNVCLEAIAKIGQIRPKDIPTVEKLRQDFILDLALLRGKTDGIQARVQDLEATQFSATAKLNGLVNFAVMEVFAGEGETQTVWQQRVRLEFNQNFTERDRLQLQLTAGNGTVPQLAGGTSEVVQTQQFFGDTSNQFEITNLSYSWAIGEKFYLNLAAVGGMHSDYKIAPINPFLDDNNAGTTSLSVFGQKNAIESLGGGTGLGIIYERDDSLSIGIGYYAAEAFDATEGKGLFNGTHTAGIEVRWQANEDLTVGLNYLRGYFSRGDFAFDSNGRVLGFAPSSGTSAVNNILAQFPTIANSYGGEFFWRVNPHIGLGGWVGYTDAEAIDRGNAEIWNYALTLVFPDLGQEGNLGGIIFGAQPYLASFTGEDNFTNDTPFHLEIFYRHRLSNNISLTSGLVWQLTPEGDIDSNDIVTGTIRANFRF